MYELIHFHNQSQHDTYGRDAFGEFGALLATDADLSIPELSDFQSKVHNVYTETTDS
jgi:hypothetical protein